MLLSDIPVQILRDITLISVFTRMLSVTWASFMILSVGILLSTLFNHKKHHLFKVFTSLYFFMCIAKHPLLLGMYNISCSIRNLLPIYWCNPWNVYSKPTCISADIIGMICLLIGSLIFKKKSVY